MARKPSIRITQNDRKEYARLVKNTKAKINRTIKKYGSQVNTVIDNEVVSTNVRDLVEIRDLESFGSRQEYNEWKQKLQSFTNRNNRTFQFKKNAYDVVASQKLISKIEKDQKVIERQEEVKRKAVENLPTAGQIGTVGQRMLQMGRPNVVGFRPTPKFDFDKIRDSKSLLQKAQNMNERSDPQFVDKRLRQMKDNYITMLEKAFNSDADHLIDKIKSMPDDDFYQLYLQEFLDFDFDLYYINKEFDNDGEWADSGYLDSLKRMERHVDSYLLGNISFPLKPF